MKRFLNVASAAATALVCAACGGEDTNEQTPQNQTYDLNLTVSGLEALSEGVYEGWLIYGDEKVSTGTFTEVSGITQVSDRDPASADKFVVTIEPVPDTDPGPSGVIVLEGDISGSSASLSFPVDLNPASGGFILRTPTDDPGTPDNDEAGVWFLQMGANGPMTALNLPTLPSGWVYEGWGVTQGTPLTTGRFTAPDAADAASPYSDGGPPFPGEDFLMNLPAPVTGPVNLADGNSLVVISVEPDIAGVDPTGDGPFALKPLATAVPADHPGATFTSLDAGPVITVSGQVTF